MQLLGKVWRADNDHGWEIMRWFTCILLMSDDSGVSRLGPDAERERLRLRCFCYCCSEFIAMSDVLRWTSLCGRGAYELCAAVLHVAFLLDYGLQSQRWLQLGLHRRLAVCHFDVLPQVSPNWMERPFKVMLYAAAVILNNLPYRPTFALLEASPFSTPESRLNPLKNRDVNWLHLAIQV